MTGFLHQKDLVESPDGRFEIVLSARQQPGNWLRMTAETDTLMVREVFGDPAGARPSIVRIERLDAPAKEAPLTGDAVVRALGFAAASARSMLDIFGDWTRRLAEKPNRLVSDLFSKEEIIRIGGSPSITYIPGYWKVDPGEALVIEVRPQRGDDWSFQLMTYWQENVNLPSCASHLNYATAQPDPDGTVRIVVAGADPRAANWVDTGGHTQGVMMFRWQAVDGDRPAPTARLVLLTSIKPEAASSALDRHAQVAPGYLVQRFG